MSSTDRSYSAPIIKRFFAHRPDVFVEHLVNGKATLNEVCRENPDRFDIASSSAMDLQFNRTNIGFLQLLDGLTHPDWVQSRKSLFAFSTKPAAIVINTAAFDGVEIPATRQDLIDVMGQNADLFREKSWDIRCAPIGAGAFVRTPRCPRIRDRLTPDGGDQKP